MNEVLKDAYHQYRSAGFVLQKAAKNKKHAHREGAYAERENEPWVDSATGYVGIIPPNLIIVDDDSYKNPDEDMFNRLCNDLDLGYVPEPFALTPSGGKHYAFHNPHENMVIGNIGKKYPNLDIYAGYQSVIPIVGTVAMNKQGTLAQYTWASFDEALIINDFNKTMLEVFEMRDRAEAKTGEYDEMGLSLAVKAQEMSDEEVTNLLQALPDDLDYDSWLAVGMCIYDRYEGNEDGFKVFDEFSKRSPEKYDEDFTRKKWDNAHLKPTQTTYKRLRSLSHEFSVINFDKEITEAQSGEELEVVIQKISSTPFLNTRSKRDGTVREALSVTLNNRYKELKKEGKVANVKQARVIIKELEHTPSIEDIEAEVERTGGEKFSVYMCGNKYVIQYGNKIVEDLSRVTALTHAISMGVSFKHAESALKNPMAISGVEIVTDYLLDEAIAYRVEEHREIEKLSVLKGRKDPFYYVEEYEHDDEILEDFFTDIWNGKAKDIIELIALTIKFKEQKLNRLMTVAPSNTGKTELYQMLGFQKITMSRLLNGLRGDKGIGSQVINGVRASGLLLIDETNKALEAEIKDMDKDLYVDEFGAGGGTQIIPLHFTALTSTHKTATRNNSDELYNRFLQVELTEGESKHHVTASPVFQKDSTRYTEVIKGYSRWYFKHILKEKKFDEEYFKALQEKYRLPLNNDLDEFLYDVSKRAIAMVETLAEGEGDIICKEGVFYIKRKTDLSGMIDDMLKEISSLDHGKYNEKLMNHFLSVEAKTIKVGGKPVKYYVFNNRTYTQDPSKQIIEMFDNLNDEEL